jgi:hypothetical protein
LRSSSAIRCTSLNADGVFPRPMPGNASSQAVVKEGLGRYACISLSATAADGGNFAGARLHVNSVFAGHFEILRYREAKSLSLRERRCTLPAV